MDRNTYTPAARKALEELSKSAEKKDADICKSRQRRNAAEIYGEISLDSEGVVNTSDPNVYTLDSLGMIIKAKGHLLMSQGFPRSCQPTCKLNHRFGTNVLLDVYVGFTGMLPAGTFVTLPFNKDWINSSVPLDCVFHLNGTCPFEKERQKVALQKSNASTEPCNKKP